MNFFSSLRTLLLNIGPFSVRTLVVCAALVAIHATGGAAASAEAQPVSISVSVTDEKAQPLSQAIAEVRIQGQVAASALTDEKGKTALTLPTEGRYLLTVSKKGYLTAESTLEVKSDSPAEIDVTLTSVALSQQDITVRETSPDPVFQESSVPVSLTPTQAKQTPSKPATLTEALPLVPGVVRANDGSLGIAGYGESHSTLLVNSVDVTDPSTGDFGLSVPIDSVSTISVSEMPYLAQYGKFIAGVVAAETRPGGEKWNFSLNDPLPEFRIRSGHLTGLKTASPRLNVSGPLISNRLYVSEGAEYLVYKQPVRTLPFPVNETRSSAINSFTQVDATISSSHTLTASLHVAPHSLDYAGLDFFNPQPVTPDARVHAFTGTVIDRLSISGGLLQSTVALTSVSSDIKPQGLADMILTPVGNRGNYFSEQSRGATRLAWLENWAPHSLHFRGDHNLQFGSVLGHSEDEGQFLARPARIQDANGHTLQRIDFTAGKPFDLTDFEPAVYVQDHWILNSRFALDFGIRLEEQTITYTTRAAPRSGFVWTPDRDRKTVLRGGIGVFYDSVPLSTYAFSSYPEQIITSYNASGGVLAGPQLYRNVTQQTRESSFPFVDRFQRSGNFAPYSVAWNLELERQISRAVTVRVKYLQSRAEDMISLQPQLVQNQGFLLLGSSGAARARQLEMTARIGAETRRQFFFSYVRQHARGNVNDGSAYLGNYPFPVVRQSLFASLPNEIPNRFLLWGSYALPKKVQLNPHIEYRNGFPYRPSDSFQQYIPLGAGPQYRFPRYFAFDLLVSKDFQIGKKHAIRLSVPMLNITNHFNPLEVHSNIADPSYGNFFGNYPRRFLLDFDFLN
jgi:hypothetical protein